MDLFNIELDKRIFGLDLLRAAAILFVVYSHGIRFIQDFVSMDKLTVMMYDGVTLFFVLSGFLIGRILIKIYFKEDELSWHDLWHFWVRRWFRTIPPYFIMLTILLGFGLVYGLNQEINYIKYYLFIQNMWYQHPPFFPEAWSLSVEEWFYLSFPFMLFVGALLLRLRSKGAFLFLVGSFFMLGIAFRSYWTLDAINNSIYIGEIHESFLRKVVLSRVDSMMLGVFAAYLFYFHKNIWEKGKLFYFFIGLGFFILTKNFPYNQYPFVWGVFAFQFVSLGTFFMLPLLNSIKNAKGIFAKLIVMISISSYSMYLINHSIALILHKRMPLEQFGQGLFAFLIYLIICFIISFAAYQYIERPILNYRDRLYSKQSL